MKKMKILALSLLLIPMVSCEKKDKEKEDVKCPVVTETSLPEVVRVAFRKDHENTANVVWFNKDNSSFCAMYVESQKEYKMFFSNSGSLLKTEVDENAEEEDDNEEHGWFGGHQDEDDDEDEDEGCDCEL